MIVNLIISAFVSLISVVFIFLPEVTIFDIWFIGPQLNDMLVWWIQMWNAFMLTFPYAQTAWDVFIWTILPFEFTMVIQKFFFGSRAVDAGHNAKK